MARLAQSLRYGLCRERNYHRLFLGLDTSRH